MEKTSIIIGRALAPVTLLLALLLPYQASAQSTSGCARVVTVRTGDTLTEIAETYLADPGAYESIVDATNARARTDDAFPTIRDETLIQIGWQLCIPPQAAIATPALDEDMGGPDGNQTAEETLLFDAEQLTIDFLRKGTYPGSEIEIEEVLAPGENYDRYIASYLSEGLKQYGLLTVPQGKKPATGWPVIVFNHGYIPPEVYRPTERYVAYVDALARNGYIVFRPDYRGNGFSEGEARGAYGAPDYVIDVLNAVASIKQYPDADPKRIGMWGHSMGGYITLRTMVTTEDVKAGVIWAGVVASYPDLVERWNRRTSDIPERARRWRTQLLEQYGTPAENPEFWNSISANSYLQDLSGPVQIHHGTADATVPIEFSVKLYDQLKAASQPGEIYTYLGDDHNIAQSFDQAMARTLAYFDKYVKR